MEISLSFSLGLGYRELATSTYEVVEFDTVEEKNEYVKAEYSDIKCQIAFRNYSASITMEDRYKTAILLNNARYSFYKKWILKNAN